MHKGGKKSTKVNVALVSVEEIVSDRREGSAGVLQWLKKKALYLFSVFLLTWGSQVGVN